MITIGDATIYVGSCLDTLSKIEAKSVQCCVTSPPYFGLRDYGHEGQLGLEPTPDQFVANLVEVFREVKRVLKDDGTLWLNLGDSYAANRTYQVPSTKGGPKHSNSQAAGGKGSSVPVGLKPKDLIGIPWMVAFALRADGWYLRSDIIWAKTNPMPESVTDRPSKSHEYIFLLTKSEKYFYDNEAVKEKSTQQTGAAASFKRETKDHLIPGQNAIQHRMDRDYREDNGRRNKRSVWQVSTVPYAGAHFATFPPKLIEPCILAGTRAGDTVLDPFNGSGTTGIVALNHDRKYIGCEINPEYVELTVPRLELAQEQMKLF